MTGGRSHALTAATGGNESEIPVTYPSANCDGSSVVEGSQPVVEMLVHLAGVPDLAMLTGAPEAPGHFAGSATVLHSEEPRPGGGQ